MHRTSQGQALRPADLEFATEHNAGVDGAALVDTLLRLVARGLQARPRPAGRSDARSPTLPLDFLRPDQPFVYWHCTSSHARRQMAR